MSKYNAQKTVIDGITFDSKKEAHRYQELKWMQRAGQITDLKLQVPYEIIPSMKSPTTGRKVQATKYIADFVYRQRGLTVVEDVKGVRTQGYLLKKKLMLFMHGIEIREV